MLKQKEWKGWKKQSNKEKEVRTQISLGHKQPKHIASKSMKKVYGPSTGNKCQITILACSNAISTMLPPIINYFNTYVGECLNHELTKGGIPNTVYMEYVATRLDQPRAFC